MVRHYLDPYAILATLGFGVFLFNVIFNLLNNNAAASGRSLDVQDIDLPLELSDISKFSVKDVSVGSWVADCTHKHTLTKAALS